MAAYCTQCGTALPESGLCPCQAKETIQEAAAPIAQATEAPVLAAAPEAAPSEAPAVAPTAAPTAAPASAKAPVTEAQINAKVDDVMQKTTAFLGGALAFFKLFAKSPVTAMKEGSLKMGEAIFFAALQPLMLFFLFLTMSNRVSGAISDALGMIGGFGMFGSYLPTNFLPGAGELFFHAIAICLGGLVSLLVLAVIFGKVLGKGKIQLVKLFTLTVVAHIPLTISFLLALIFSFFSIQLVMVALFFGISASIIIGTFAFAAAFELEFDRCVYCSICTYAVQALLLIAAASGALSGALPF